MELVSPSCEYEDIFLAFLDDIKRFDAPNAEFYEPACSSFSKYVQSLIDESRGVNLPEGYVPCNHYWFLNQKGKMVGVLRIRHHIETPFLFHEGGHIGYDIAPSFREQGNGTQMLKHGLVKAKQLGLEKVLITADEDNIASRKVIEANGGVLEQIVMGRFFPCLVAKYWVTCQ